MTLVATRRTIVALAGMAAGLASTAALAHTGAGLHMHASTGLDHFMAGLSHPLTGLDHLAAMVSVGLWSASAPSAARRLGAPLAFAAMLLMGALMASAGARVAGVEPMIAASLLVLGLLLATQTRMRTLIGATLAGGFALFHGMAHGQELASGAMGALGGMLLSTLALHALGLAGGLALQQRHSWMPRLAGAMVAMSGASLLVPAVAAAL